MRLVLATLVTLTLTLTASTAFACGGDDADEFLGKQAAYSAMKGQLTCTLDGKTSAAQLGVFAIYRCFNSPVWGRIEAFGKTSKLRSVTQLSETSFEMITEDQVAPIECVLN